MGARGAVRNPPLRGASLQHKSGCGSVWLERYLREVEAASSNLVTPTLCLREFRETEAPVTMSLF